MKMQLHSNGTSKKILLIVDDVEMNRTLLILYCKELGLNCIEAVNGLDAVNKMNDDIKIVFMDIMMPVLGGIEATFKIKAKYNVPVIAQTGRILEPHEREIFDDVLYKPYSQKEFNEIVNKYL